MLESNCEWYKHSRSEDGVKEIKQRGTVDQDKRRSTQSLNELLPSQLAKQCEIKARKIETWKGLTRDRDKKGSMQKPEPVTAKLVSQAYWE